MHRTLFSPAMVESFRACKRAYALAYLRFSSGAVSGSLTGACKRFVLKALAEINKGKLSTVHQVQKYMGQGWPLDKVGEDSSEKEMCTRAFLFAFKALTRYVAKPYRPDGAEIVSVALKARARVAHVRVYVEDTIDLVLWHQADKRLELVNFQMQPLKPNNPAWPTASSLIKAHLAERLKIRWPYEKLSITTYRVGSQDYAPSIINVDESLYRLHWEELTKTLEEMKQPPARDTECSVQPKNSCRQCDALSRSSVSESATLYAINALSA